ncbi:ABC-2 type transport system permease protein [Halobacillus alkaliphilus]|uniref:ABC-2 type transport system permease protein n=1 Tax=Halobacillus alkaliphilus TaxID=396056 RepID=A0A1I2S4N4_9BACI|nr:ABC transporter permease [Halobacillus alkaliphilus]SFG47710.1 ABC-2 type transport system permease protein [Halobacillus alkaliphilus]
MNKFFIMMGHTYRNRVKSKSFLITTIITVLIIFGLTNLQQIINSFSSDEEEKTVAMIAENEDWIESIKQQMGTNQEVAVETYSGSLEEAKEKVEAGDFQSVTVLEEAENGLPQADYYANQVANTGTSEPIRQALQQLKVQIITERANVDDEVLQQISAPVAFELNALEESAKTAEELNQTRGLVYVMLFFMYFAVMMYGNMISTEVATEKSSRVMEILISSVSPVNQMFAKIIGIALVGLTQYGIFILVGYLGIQQSKNSGSGSLLESFGLTNVDPLTVVYALVFFVLGYLLYATLAATLGSLVSRLEDAQQIVAPMMMLVIAAFLISMYGLAQPDAAFITISSYFPFFAPLTMFLRVGMLDIPIWEVLLSIGILIGSIALLAILGARIYRGGVLMYGKSSSLKDLKTALQLSKKEK